ncbi:MAG: FG-GAP-like repeat-containing protein [Pseudomonadota bacterium]|nr:FG-GAP-like repeat-containing protein [Pseudomonadota bacterium]
MKKIFSCVLLLAAITGCSNDWSAGLADRPATIDRPRSTSAGTAATGAVAAIAPDQRGPRAFASAPDLGSLVQYPRTPVVRRSGAYTYHAAELSEEHALRSTVTGDLSFTAPDGTPINLAYERHVEHPDGNWSWIGRSPDGRVEDTVITFGETAVFGTIPQRGDRPELRLTMADGRAWVVAADPRLLRDVRNEATHPTRQDFLIPGELSTALGSSAVAMEAETADSGSGVVQAAATANGKTILDVLVGFTGGYSQYRGGDAAAITRVHNLVDITNQSFANSQVAVQVRLVHTMKVAYPDATDNGTALEELTGFKAPSTRTTPAAAFSALRSSRDQYGADLVVLLRRFQEPENKGCGIAWLIGGGQTGVDPTDRYFGYSVVGDGSDSGTDGKSYYCRDETFAHEIGHNMGSQHDSANAKDDDGGVSYGVFTYSFGLNRAAGAGNFFTVMSYGESSQTRSRVFSNPDVSICGADQNLSCGVANQADNARSLRSTAAAVSGFRATVVPLNSGGERRVRHDIDGDGLADMLFYRPRDGHLLPWLADPAAGFVALPGIAVGGQFRIIATGDFNGDGMMDLIWNRPAGDMQYWHGDAQGGFSKRQFFAWYPSEWTLAGTGDIDGDGKTDLVWHRARDGLLAYWVMNGPQIARHGGVRVGGTWRVIAIDDFNGDGKADLIWNRSAGDMQYWEGDGASFARRQFFTHYPRGWDLRATGDVDGDGKSDFLWHRPTDNRLATWLMSGPTITKHQGQYFAFEENEFFLDVNGDGMLDLFSAYTRSTSPRAGEMYVYPGRGSGFGSEVTGPFGYFPEGYVVVR